MGIFASHKRGRKKEIHAGFSLVFMPLHQLTRNTPTLTFPALPDQFSSQPRVVHRHAERRKKNGIDDRTHQLHGKALIFRNCHFAFRVYLSRNARPCHARICHPSFLPASPRTNNATPNGTTGNLVALGATGALGGTGLEAVLEAAVDVAQRAHAAAAGGLAALGLLTPVDCSRKNRKPNVPTHGLQAIATIQSFVKGGFPYTCGS